MMEEDYLRQEDMNDIVGIVPNGYIHLALLRRIPIGNT